jgi:twitching motility protein PilT
MTEPRDPMERFADWLRQLNMLEGSDLHIKPGSPPLVRAGADLRRLDYEPVTGQLTEWLASKLIPENRRERFEHDGAADFALSEGKVGRFRANVFRQRGSVSMVFRKVRMGGPSFDEAGLPPVVQQLADEFRGLVLVTGPTGSGKTTTLAAMIEHINSTRSVHIVTIEDPIEILFHDKRAAVNQRQVGEDCASFLDAIRSAMRQDPDVILIGEMRDQETVRAALQAAETGHLVLSTLHTLDATETVNRVLDFFPPHQQQQARFTLAGSLRGIICQRLVPSTTGGRLPCLEVLVNTGRISDRIVDPNTTSEIHEVLEDGEYYGMRTFDQSLVNLVAEGKVTVQSALETATSPHDLELMLKSRGVVDVSASLARCSAPGHLSSRQRGRAVGCR